MNNDQVTQPAIPQEKRQPCEVWTRVMGYHRPVASFNAGKQAEHAERRFFREPDQGISE
ncbi:MAG TPA: anaerobic ribonucleoside-triphosphate reductase [Geobacteraceae bacterium]|nr:anaerobic ribonucleoside-triphosphate reductase [Geobacteraceae bacterium]